VGLFDFFKRRRERESAVQLGGSSEAAGSFGDGQGQPVVGSQVGGGTPQASIDLQGLGMMDGLAMLSQLGPMIQQAMEQGNVTVTQSGSQAIDARGTDLGEEIKGIMREHGIDPDGAQAGQSLNPADFGNMQQQILDALAKHGIDPNAAGSSVNFQIEASDDDD
jgi:hypothetical protein